MCASPFIKKIIEMKYSKEIIIGYFPNFPIIMPLPRDNSLNMGSPLQHLYVPNNGANCTRAGMFIENK